MKVTVIVDSKVKKRTKPTKRSCFRCGRDSHWVAQCYAKKHVDGSIIDESDDDDYN